MMTDIFTTIINITTSNRHIHILSIKINAFAVNQSKDIMDKFIKIFIYL